MAADSSFLSPKREGAIRSVLFFLFIFFSNCCYAIQGFVSFFQDRKCSLCVHYSQFFPLLFPNGDMSHSPWLARSAYHGYSVIDLSTPRGLRPRGDVGPFLPIKNHQLSIIIRQSLLPARKEAGEAAASSPPPSRLCALCARHSSPDILIPWGPPYHARIMAPASPASMYEKRKATSRVTMSHQRPSLPSA